MSENSVSDVRENLAELIDRARRTGEPAFITRRGRRVAVILGSESYEKLVEDAEDALDRAELQLARDDDDYVPWDEVKAELGLA